MSINEIKSIINSLSENDFNKLRNWFLERDWKKWDKQIEQDSNARKLDFLFNEAFEDKKKGNLKTI